MAKLHLDKYYTPQSLADYCTQKAIEVIGVENITELVESSAGNGVFLNSFEKLLPNIPYKAYDIEPEDDRITKQDYLELEMEYKKGRVVIGNPPFGDKNNLLWKFYSKAVENSDYICFILPISQFNNNQQLFEFNLIHSEDLGKMTYSDRKIHCSFNIFKRPINGINKKKINYNLKDITIKENRQSRNQYIPKDYNYDIGICVWGEVGKVLEYEKQYCQFSTFT